MNRKSMIDRTTQSFWSGLSTLEDYLRKKFNTGDIPGLSAWKMIKPVKQKKNLVRMRALYNCCRKTIGK